MTKPVFDSKAIVLYQPKQTSKEFISSILEKQITEVMRRSLESARYFENRLKLFGEGKIFCLIGTSTAGKTSIIQQLKKDDPQWIELGFNLEAQLYVADVLKTSMKAHYDEIAQAIDHNNIAKAIFCDQVILKENIPSAIVEKAYKTLEEVRRVKAELEKTWESNFSSIVELRVADKVIALSLDNQNVILDFFDMIFFIKHLMSNHFCAPVRLGLVYCPLNLLIERVLIRNQRAFKERDNSNIRFPMQLLFQFVDKYKGCVNPHDKDKVLDTLSINQFEEIFEKVFSLKIKSLEIKLKESNNNLQLIKEIEKSRKDHCKIKKKLMGKIGFTDSSIQRVFIVSRFKDYHHLFNTQKMLPQNSSKFIRELNY